MPNKYYVFDDRNCKFESMTKEEIINAIAQATGVTPADVDEGFISTIVETNRSRSIHIWKGTQAEYNALETHDSDTYYIIDDDSTIDDIESQLHDLSEALIDNLYDTGWVIMRHNNDIVGRYRMIGKIVYYEFDITMAGSHAVDNVVTIHLPISIGIGSIDMPVINHTSTGYRVGVAHVTGFADNQYMEFRIYDGASLAQMTGELMLYFSCPILENS